MDISRSCTPFSSCFLYTGVKKYSECNLFCFSSSAVENLSDSIQSSQSITYSAYIEGSLHLHTCSRKMNRKYDFLIVEKL